MSVDLEVREQQGKDFLKEEALLWIIDWYFVQKRQFKKLKCLNDRFIYYKRGFSLHNILIYGALLITEMFLLSVWTLILTAPIHCRACANMLVSMC